MCREVMFQQKGLSALLACVRTFLVCAAFILAALLNDGLDVLRRLKVLQVFSHVMLHCRLKIIGTYNNLNRFQLRRCAHLWLHFAMLQLLDLLIFAVFQRLQNFLNLD